MSKSCAKCGEAKPVSEFYRYSGRDGYRPRCKACYCDEGREYSARAEVKAHRKAIGPEKERRRNRSPESIMRARLWTWHRMTLEQFDERLAAQGGRCAICKETVPGGRGRFHVDHDHTCCPGARSCGNCVRGLLCSRCNPMIGMARDDAEVLRSGADYVASGGNNALLSAIGEVGNV